MKGTKLLRSYPTSFPAFTNKCPPTSPNDSSAPEFVPGPSGSSKQGCWQHRVSFSDFFPDREKSKTGIQPVFRPQQGRIVHGPFPVLPHEEAVPGFLAFRMQSHTAENHRVFRCKKKEEWRPAGS